MSEESSGRRMWPTRGGAPRRQRGAPLLRRRASRGRAALSSTCAPSESRSRGGERGRREEKRGGDFSVTRWVWSHAASEIRKKPPSFLPRGASRLSLLGNGENYSCTRRGPERGERGRGGMNEGYKEGGGEARSKEEREGSKPCCDLFLVLSESTESLSLSLFFQQREEEKNEDKMRSPRFFFGLLALTALASVASCSSSAPPTSDVVPSVDPELNWLTPQEFKVEKAGQEKRSIALSPSSSEFRIAKRAGLVLRPARTIPRSWAPSKRKRSWLRRQGQSYRAQRREEKGEKAAEAFCFLAVALAAIDLFFFFPLYPSPSPPPSPSNFNHRSSTSRKTPSQSCTSSPARGAPPATPSRRPWAPRRAPP